MGLEGRFKLFYGRYVFVIRCDVEWYVLCTIWNVCGLDGLQSEKWWRMNGVVKKSVWSEMVA